MTPLELLVRDFLSSCRARGLSAKTIDQTYKPRLERQFLTWARANAIHEVQQINQRTIERYQADLFDSGLRKKTLSTSTVNSYVRTLNVFLSWARAEGEQVSAKGKLARTPRKLVETLTREEIQSMERVANQRDALIVRLLADTGIRAGELCGLQIDDLIEHERYDYLSRNWQGREGTTCAGPRGSGQTVTSLHSLAAQRIGQNACLRLAQADEVASMSRLVCQRSNK
jgi:integrase